MERKLYLVAMAGGHGARMGADRPKQFLRLGGKPLLRLSVERFIEAYPAVKVVTVLPQAYMQTWKDYCLGEGFLHPQVLAEGGITRFHSVRNALSRVPDGVIVAIHDGVRPLVSPELVRRMAERMGTGDPLVQALIPVVPVTDTLKAVRAVTDSAGGPRLEPLPGEDPDRSRIFAAQTPQMFLSEEIKAAYSQAYDTRFTDDASVAAAYGIPLTYCEGERSNIKITTPEDMLVAEAFRSRAR